MAVFSQTVTDYDGNVYETITINEQVWMKDNLRALHYADGSEITDIYTYEGIDNYVDTYGYLYTWNAAMNNLTTTKAQGACPDGWHIPDRSEWNALFTFLGGKSVAGGKLKETGTDNWTDPNTGASNSSGFSARGAGEKAGSYQLGVYQYFKDVVLYWSSNMYTSEGAYYYAIMNDKEEVREIKFYRDYAYSVRCIQDEAPTSVSEQVNSKLHCYPNPFSFSTTITLPGHSEKCDISVYNTIGQKVDCSFEQHDNNLIIHRNNLNAGLYFYKIRNNNKEINTGSFTIID